MKIKFFLIIFCFISITSCCYGPVSPFYPDQCCPVRPQGICGDTECAIFTRHTCVGKIGEWNDLWCGQGGYWCLDPCCRVKDCIWMR